MELEFKFAKKKLNLNPQINLPYNFLLRNISSTKILLEI